MREGGAKKIGKTATFRLATPSFRSPPHDGVNDGVNRWKRSPIFGKIRSDRVVDTHNRGHIWAYRNMSLTVTRFSEVRTF